MTRIPSLLLIALAVACSPAPQQSDASATITPEQSALPPTSSLPAVDTAIIQARLTPDETLEALTFEPIGTTNVSGAVEGYKAKVWAVPVSAGQTLSIDFQTTSTNLYINVYDSADTSGAAVHRGETDGPTATLSPARDTVYLIKPFQPRATARRNERGDYALTVSRS